MSNPFAIGMRVLFANPHLREGIGVYTSVAGRVQQVSVIERREEEVTALLSGGVSQPALVYDLLVAEVPTRPANGATLQFPPGTTYRIRQALPDKLGLTWQLDVEPL